VERKSSKRNRGKGATESLLSDSFLRKTDFDFDDKRKSRKGSIPAIYRVVGTCDISLKRDNVSPIGTGRTASTYKYSLVARL
jgi:hypothetical protein